MTVHWFVTCASLLVALIAFRQARRTAKRFELFFQNYRELKFLNGELRVKLQQFTGESAPQQPTAPTAAQGRDSFIPLSSLKR